MSQLTSAANHPNPIPHQTIIINHNETISNHNNLDTSSHHSNDHLNNSMNTTNNSLNNSFFYKDRLNKPLILFTIKTELRRLLAEFYGTFFLVLISSGIKMTEFRTGNIAQELGISLASGFVLIPLIYSLGQISGCHINPAITLAFFLSRKFSFWRLPGYWIVQFGGGIFASFMLWLLFGTDELNNLGAPSIHVGNKYQAFGFEIIVSFFLISVVLNISDRGKMVGPNVSLAVGFTVATLHLFADPISTIALNPARSLGPFIIANYYRNCWVWIAGPFVGACLAVILNYLFSFHKPHEDTVGFATGTGKSTGEISKDYI